MPFFKWIIRSNEAYNGNTKKTNRCLPEESFHRALVQALHELSELLSVADEIFTGVMSDCQTIQTRTDTLKSKVQNCQHIVDRLNAKAVKVPVSSLINNCQQTTDGQFKSFQKFDIGFFLSDSRPNCVRRLHKQAQGPSPPVYPQLYVVNESLTREQAGVFSDQSELEFFECAFDAYNNSSRSESLCDSTSPEDALSAEAETPDINSQATIVPIDVSGYTFQRMATLRRSLIHMDFLSRKKKKKDKRRNSVADIESNALKDAIQPIDNGKQRFSVPCTPVESENYQDTLKTIINKNESQVPETRSVPNIIYMSSEENNNSKSFVDSVNKKTDSNVRTNEEKLGLSCRLISKDSYVNSKPRHDENSTNSNDSVKQTADWAKRIKDSAESRKKSRTHIPISTLSAAMTVAVKMRQTSGLHSEDAQSSSGNWSGSNSSGRASSDSDEIKASLKDKVSSSKDSLLSESTPTHESKESPYSFENERKRMEDSVGSYIAEKHLVNGNNSSIFVKKANNSFDSDDDLSTTSYLAHNRYVSSTSISTGSNESLNSLLSRTATELSGSTETLTSLSKLPLPPPPPPPRISSAKINHAIKIEKALNVNFKTYPINRKPQKKENSPPINNLCSQENYSKTREIRAPVETNQHRNSKVSFSTMFQKKFKSKDHQDKSKRQNSTKLQKLKNSGSNSSGIDMYGGQVKSDQIATILINENKPQSPAKPKVQMRSFLPKTNTSKELSLLNGYSDLNETPSLYSSSRASSRTGCASPTSSDMYSDSAIESSDETNVPFKYAPQITVMPLRRSSDPHPPSVSPCSCKNYDFNFYNKPSTPVNVTNKNISHDDRDIEIYQQKIQQSTLPSSISNGHAASRHTTTAHVVLDANGHVVHSTNSLDRRLYNKVSQINLSQSSSVNSNTYNSYSEKTPYSDVRSLTPSGLQKCAVPYFDNPNQLIKTSTPYSRVHILNENSFTLPSPTNSQNVSYNLENKMQQNNTYYGSLPCRGKSDLKNSPSINSSYQNHSFRNPPSNLRLQTTNQIQNNTCVNSPSSQSLLTQENVQQHLEKTEQLHSLPRPAVNRSFSYNGCYEPKFNLNLKESEDNFQRQQTVKSMTAEDLFAIIHNSKKRLNIKTESDLSPTPSSSRSESPSFFRQVTTSSKNGLAETGFLSPRGSCILTSRDRRSWADFRPVSERKSLAMDRMGPNKPTSLHEFKMLLLQTRSNTRNSQRQSAVEQLKATSPNRSMDLNETFSSNSSPLSPIQNSVAYNVYDGHLTVPLKRGHRSRGTMQPKYIMYPPIMEDCSEETENSSEVFINNSSKGLPSSHSCISSDRNWRTDDYVNSNKTTNDVQSQPKVRFANSSMWV